MELSLFILQINQQLKVEKLKLLLCIRSFIKSIFILNIQVLDDNTTIGI
jgi:hypothetical protein